jgi:uncharacterized protein
MGGRASLAGNATFATAKVTADIVLDSRLALYHEKEHWLAIADLHYGYELNRRLEGGLTPLWGMAKVEERLLTLLQHYLPKRLIMVGDIMDGRGSVAETLSFIESLRKDREVVCIIGNHDSPLLRSSAQFTESHSEADFFFHHGHQMEYWQSQPGSPRIHVTGHLHPAHVFRDGAGLKLKLPAFVQRPAQDGLPEQWILPAFSPWAGGVSLDDGKSSSVWACAETRILKLP